MNGNSSVNLNAFNLLNAFDSSNATDISNAADALNEFNADVNVTESGDSSAEAQRENQDNTAYRAVRSILKTYRSRIWAPFVSGIKEYGLIKEGDRIAVCMSGGKDSALLAVLMKQLQRYSDFPFEVCYIVMNPGYSEANLNRIRENAAKLEIPIDMFDTNIFGVTEKTERNPCYLCARMRRGHLYSYAKSKGCNKIALGHHFSDVIETTLWGAQIQGMLPRLSSTNYEGMELIRPMYKVHEDDIISWARYNGLDFLACACRMTESSVMDEDKSKRRETKRLIRELKKTNPDIEKNIFNSIHMANIDTLVGYKLNGVKHSFSERFD